MTPDDEHELAAVRAALAALARHSDDALEQRDGRATADCRAGPTAVAVAAGAGPDRRGAGVHRRRRGVLQASRTVTRFDVALVSLLLAIPIAHGADELIHAYRSRRRRRGR